jgi:hypothetical protein
MVIDHSRLGATERPSLEVHMRRFSKLLILVAVTAALVLATSSVAAATSTVTYDIAGVEYAANFAQSSFAGAAVSADRTEYGVWNAIVFHDQGRITGGTFAFKSKRHSFTGEFSVGTFGTATGDCAKKTFGVSGPLSGGGNFDVTVARYGYMSGATCVVYLATVRGTATLVFP